MAALKERSMSITQRHRDAEIAEKSVMNCLIQYFSASSAAQRSLEQRCALPEASSASAENVSAWLCVSQEI